jgi:aerobic-type carbon monoxide dehydrogenase small subunit (CoxS/CutS family)
MKVQFTLNGKSVTTAVIPGETLFEYLRKNEFYSVKYGCDHGECGACTVLIDGLAYNACLILIHTLKDRLIETVESLANKDELSRVQKSFIDHGAIQCGYCTPGMILSTEALLRENPSPTESEIRDTMAGNLCRCTGYVKPVEAIK